jgi:RNA polymerase sigma factor (sigma-70 family)
MAAIDWHTTLGQHDRWLRTVVLARIGQAGAVDEVMQEVALAAVDQRSPIADVTRLAPWLYRLAVVQSLLFLRKQGRRRKLAARYAQQVPPSEHDPRSADPLDWLVAVEQQQMVRRAVARLPAREAEMLMLKYTEHWSYEQLAQHLGISESAVESRLHRARARLRRELAAYEELQVPR